jgi:hypothetical protein
MYPYQLSSGDGELGHLGEETSPDVAGLHFDWSRMPDSQVPARRVGLPSTRKRKVGRFIPPIPLGWFQRACQLPGKAPVVLASVLWYLYRLKKSNTFVLAQARLNDFGISRRAKYRALDALEAAGLISVERRPKKSPVVPILDRPPDIN